MRDLFFQASGVAARGGVGRRVWRGAGALLFLSSVAPAQGGYAPPVTDEEGSSEESSPDASASSTPDEPVADAVPPPPVPPAVGDEEEDGDEEAPKEPDGEAREDAPQPTTVGGKRNLSLAAEEAEPSFKVHGIFAGAKATGGYQAREFGFGVGGLAALEWGPTPSWGLQAEGGFVYLAGTKKEPPTGLAELDGAAGAHLGLGLRIRPLAKSKVLPHPAGPWLSGAFGAAFTGGGFAPLFDAFVGYDFETASNMSVGPTLGYMHVVQTDKTGPRTDSANILLLGIHGTFDFGVAEVRILDRDFDGILDTADQCPDKPEDKDGFEDEDGCPELDNDEDGIRDVDDQCPLAAEDVDKFEDEDGCPDLDNDADGIPDVKDQCPLEPEDLDDFEDEDGCPEPDNDGDGIPDLKDLCPNEPETRNGIADNDGCPDEESIRVVGDKIELDQKIHFWTNSDRIRGMSYPVLNKLAAFLNAHPEYVHVDIEGHADARGDAEFNLDLSKRRAASILKFLAEQGVDEERLASEGFGSTRPLVEGKTEHAWFMNRRVEFVVTRHRHEKVNPETGETISGGPGDAPVFGTDKQSGEAAP